MKTVEKRGLLVLFMDLLHGCSPDMTRNWWRRETEEGLIDFFEVVLHAVETFQVSFCVCVSVWSITHLSLPFFYLPSFLLPLPVGYEENPLSYYPNQTLYESFNNFMILTSCITI